MAGQMPRTSRPTSPACAASPARRATAHRGLAVAHPTARHSPTPSPPNLAVHCQARTRGTRACASLHAPGTTVLKTLAPQPAPELAQVAFAILFLPSLLLNFSSRCGVGPPGSKQHHVLFHFHDAVSVPPDFTKVPQNFCFSPWLVTAARVADDKPVDCAVYRVASAYIPRPGAWTTSFVTADNRSPV